MPGRPAQTQSKSKGKKSKKKGLWGTIRSVPGDFARGAIDWAEEAPTGIYHTGKTLAKSALPGKQGDEELFRLVKAQAASTKQTVKHPLRNPFETALLALAVGSAGAGTATRIGQGASAARTGGSFAKGFSKSPRYSRKMEIPPGLEFKGAPKQTVSPIGRSKKAKVSQVRRNVPDSLRSQDSNKIAQDVMGPLGNLIRWGSGIEPAYRGSVRLSKAKNPKINKVGGAYARKQATRALRQRERYADQALRGEGEAAKQSHRIAEESKGNFGIKEWLRLPGNALRLGMFSRLRYPVQNIGGTGLFLGAQQSPMRLAANIRNKRNLTPEQAEFAGNAMGNTGMASIAEGATGPISKLTQKVGYQLNRPEASMRPLALLEEARLAGTDLDKMKANPYANSAQLAMKRANEAVGDYSRLDPWEYTFMRSQFPIFYPMNKAFARYMARYPGTHPIQAAVLSQLADIGGREQNEGFGGHDPLWWNRYSIPLDKGNPAPDRILNPQNIWPFSPGGDLLTELTKPFEAGGPEYGLNIAQHAGPFPDLAFGMGMGRDLATGWPFREKDLYKEWMGMRGSVPASIKNIGPSLLPFGDIYAARDSKSFDDDLQSRALMWALGGWATPRRTNKPMYAKQLKQQTAQRRRRAATAKKYGG